MRRSASVIVIEEFPASQQHDRRAYSDGYPDRPASYQEYLELVKSSVEYQRNILRERSVSRKILDQLQDAERRIRGKISLTDIVFGEIPESALKPKPRPERPQYMVLSEDERLTAELALASCTEGNSELIIEKNNIEITKDKASCLHDREWLNDEVINFYMQILHEKYPKTFIWNSFFWLKLSSDGQGYNYKSVQRWTSRKKIDLFSFDRVIVPMNIGKNHWALGLVDFREKSIKYYDSLAEGTIHKSFVSHMKQYLSDEWKDKKKGEEMPDFNAFDTPLVYPPQQSNSFDCGVFTCMNAECLSGGRDWIDFDQSMIPDMRRKMLLQIRNGRID